MMSIVVDYIFEKKAVILFCQGVFEYSWKSQSVL